MKFTDYLHNNSKLKLTVDGLNTDDNENEFITTDTRFDWELMIQLKGDNVTYSGEGEFLCDFCEEFDGRHFESNEDELRGALKFKLINHVLDLEL